MDILLQQIVNGLVQGSIYALVALGYTMVYGIMGLINFAHGEVVMIGTLVALSVAGLLLQLGMPAAVAGFGGLAAATVVCMALGWGLERVAYRPLRHAPRLTPLITAIGMSIVLQNVAMLVWGRNYLTFPAVAPKAQFEVAGAHFTAVQVMIVVVSGLTMVGLLLLGDDPIDIHSHQPRHRRILGGGAHGHAQSGAIDEEQKPDHGQARHHHDHHLDGDSMIQHVSSVSASGKPNYRGVKVGDHTVYRFDDRQATWVKDGVWYQLSGTAPLSDTELHALVTNS
jgi:hypothetical protein